jgi:hypothetical protein
MNLKQKWYALPKWQQLGIGVLFSPLLPVVGVLAIVATVLGLVAVMSTDMIEALLGKIYGDDNE